MLSKLRSVCILDKQVFKVRWNVSFTLRIVYPGEADYIRLGLERCNVWKNEDLSENSGKKS